MFTSGYFQFEWKKSSRSWPRLRKSVHWPPFFSHSPQSLVCSGGSSSVFRWFSIGFSRNFSMVFLGGSSLAHSGPIFPMVQYRIHSGIRVYFSPKSLSLKPIIHIPITRNGWYFHPPELADAGIGFTMLYHIKMHQRQYDRILQVGSWRIGASWVLQITKSPVSAPPSNYQNHVAVIGNSPMIHGPCPAFPFGFAWRCISGILSG